MEADRDSTGGEQPLRYTQHLWGDGVRGTKAQLQALRIGENVPFPGEPGGPKRSFRTTDPRGFPVTVQREGDDLFWAAISFPGRQRPGEPLEDFAPGVKLRKGNWADEYTGTPEALEAAGIALAAHMPGQPGMRKVHVSILPDGTVRGGAPTAVNRHARGAGAKHIQRARGREFTVRVFLSDDEGKRRRNADHAADKAWESHLDSLPRPSPLVPLRSRDLVASHSSSPECALRHVEPEQATQREAEQEHIRRRFVDAYGPNVVPLRPSVVLASGARSDTAAVIELLRELLPRAMHGDLVGIGFVLYHDDGLTQIGLTGAARDNRRMASKDFSRAADYAWPHGPTHAVRQDGVRG